jgi:hypothetical protein
MIVMDAPADLEAAVAAEIERLKTPEPINPGVVPHVSVWGERISVESREQQAWIRKNMSREQRRGLSIRAAYGVTQVFRFWNDEPPLCFEGWEDFLADCASDLVKIRIETGCPQFELWSRMPEPEPEIKWPPVRIVTPTPQKLSGALRAGERHLRALIADEEAYLDRLHRLAAIVADAKAGNSLSDADRVAAYEALVPVEEIARDNEDQTTEDYVSDTLGLYFGLRVLATGGMNSTMIGHPDWVEEEPYAFCRDTLADQIERHGLAEGSPQPPPVPVVA